LLGTDSYEAEFVASTTTTYVSFMVDSVTDGAYYDFDNISVFKKQVTLGTPLATSITYLDETIEVSAGEIVDAHDFNYADTVLGFTELSENVKIVDFGTVVNNNRYVIDNPFGNENYEGCMARAEIYLNGMWSGAGFQTTTGSDGYGTVAHSNLEGVVIQTGATDVAFTRSKAYGNGFGLDTSTNITSALCRVIVTYVGGAKDA